jgi:single-strand DNA-binding protein
MTNQITGKIEMIGAVQAIQSKDGSKTFNKREIVLDATRFDPYTGERGYDNYPSFEFGGDKCAELDNFKIGQVVTVSFDVFGMKYQDKTTGEIKYFSKVRGYRIEARQPYNSQNTKAQVASGPPAQEHQPKQDLPFPPPVDRNGVPVSKNDDLPF